MLSYITLGLWQLENEKSNLAILHTNTKRLNLSMKIMNIYVISQSVFAPLNEKFVISLYRRFACVKCKFWNSPLTQTTLSNYHSLSLIHTPSLNIHPQNIVSVTGLKFHTAQGLQLTPQDRESGILTLILAKQSNSVIPSLYSIANWRNSSSSNCPIETSQRCTLHGQTN
jgi:hypothetical protein